MSVPLSVSSYFRGHRTSEGYWIPLNSFYDSSHHRYSAATYVHQYRLPVLRNSSVDGFFAITYIFHERVVHTLLRQNRDASIDVMNDSGSISQHFGNLYALLDILLANIECDFPSLPSLPLAAATASTSVSSYSTRDPIEVVVCGGEDPV